MSTKNNKIKIFSIIILSIICIVIFFNMLFETNIPILDIHAFGIKKYLKDQNYDDEFTNIEFIEKDDYVERVSCDGATWPNRRGKYYRYKVHAKKANIDFYVQYRTKLSYKDGLLTDSCGIKDSVSGYEDNYISEIFKNKILVEVKEILGEEGNIQITSPFENDVEKGVFHNRYYYLNIYFDKTLEDMYNESFLIKLKQISNPEQSFYKYNDSGKLEIVTVHFSNCELEIDADRANNEVSIYFKNNKEENERLEQYQKNVKDWLYNNHDGYRIYIDSLRENGFIGMEEYR